LASLHHAEKGITRLATGIGPGAAGDLAPRDLGSYDAFGEQAMAGDGCPERPFAGNLERIGLDLQLGNAEALLRGGPEPIAPTFVPISRRLDRTVWASLGGGAVSNRNLAGSEC